MGLDLRQISSIFFAGLLIIGCIRTAFCNEGEVASHSLDFAKKCKTIAGIMTKEQAALHRIQSLFHGSFQKTDKNNFLSLKENRCQIIAAVSPLDETGRKIDELRLYPASGTSFLFKDMVTVFGTWKTIHVSKRSSVHFTYTDKTTGTRARIYLTLNFPPKNKTSRIRIVEIRRENGRLERKSKPE